MGQGQALGPRAGSAVSTDWDKKQKVMPGQEARELGTRRDINARRVKVRNQRKARGEKKGPSGGRARPEEYDVYWRKRYLQGGGGQKFFGADPGKGRLSWKVFSSGKRRDRLGLLRTFFFWEKGRRGTISTEGMNRTV